MIIKLWKWIEFDIVYDIVFESAQKSRNLNFIYFCYFDNVMID